MHTNKGVIALFFIISFAFSANSQKVLSPWKLSKQSENIKISYRNLEVGDTLKTRQMRISFLVEASPDELISMFQDADRFSSWSARIKDCEILHDDEDAWVNYSLYNIPWPFEQKDIVTAYQIVKSLNNTTLFIKGEPNRLPYKKGISRIGKYEGRWVFTPIENGQTKVDFYSISFTRPVLPRFVQDPIVQGILLDSIKRLKNLTEA